MQSLFGLLTNTLLLKFLYPVAIGAVVYGVTAYFRIGHMESKIDNLKKQNYALQVDLTNCLEVVDGATGQIRLAEEQCRRLLQYEQNKPQPRPSAADDSDIDDLINRLLGQTPGGKADAAGKGPGPARP